MESVLALFALLIAVSLWSNVLRVNEQVLRAASRACLQLQMQLLEGSVVCTRWELAKDAQGHWRLVRDYAFEFSIDGYDRRRGEVRMLGGRITQISLDGPAGHIVETIDESPPVP